MEGKNNVDQLLKVFITVVELKNFTRAAEQLHMTQPAVSQSIKNLEERFGTILIERKNKEFFVNPAGELVYAIGKEINEKFRTMEVLVKELEHKPSGEVIIGASYTIGEYILPKLLTVLHQTYPKVHVHILIGNTKEIGKKLLNREIDLGFIEGTLIHPDISMMTFMQDNMYVCSKISEEDSNQVTMEELENAIWLIREEGSGTRDIMLQFLDDNGITPKHIITLGSTQLIKEAVQAGLGISLMSESAITKEIEHQSIHILNKEQFTVSRKFSFIKYSSSFEPKTYQVIEQKLKELWCN